MFGSKRNAHVFTFGGEGCYFPPFFECLQNKMTAFNSNCNDLKIDYDYHKNNIDMIMIKRLIMFNELENDIIKTSSGSVGVHVFVF